MCENVVICTEYFTLVLSLAWWQTILKVMLRYLFYLVTADRYYYGWDDEV